MNSRREYDIGFVGLKPGIHEFSYRITDKFFEAYQQQDFHKCEAEVTLFLDKKTGFMLLKFEIDGHLEVICDRCGNTLPLELWDEFHILVKLVDNPEIMNNQEDDPDVYYISRNESHLSVADWIYEFVNLSIPVQRTCMEKDMDGPYCNKEARDMLKKLNLEETKPENQLWKGLEKFKDLDK